MMGWYGDGWHMGWLGVTTMVIVWAALILLGVWAVSRLTRSPAPTPPTETPRQILDRRFAAGEIDAEQYAEARHLIEDHTSTGSAPAP